jgi:hypothetical protein
MNSNTSKTQKTIILRRGNEKDKYTYEIHRFEEKNIIKGGNITYRIGKKQEDSSIEDICDRETEKIIDDDFIYCFNPSDEEKDMTEEKLIEFKNIMKQEYEKLNKFDSEEFSRKNREGEELISEDEETNIPTLESEENISSLKSSKDMPIYEKKLSFSKKSFNFEPKKERQKESKNDIKLYTERNLSAIEQNFLLSYLNFSTEFYNFPPYVRRYF